MRRQREQERPGGGKPADKPGAEDQDGTKQEEYQVGDEHPVLTGT